LVKSFVNRARNNLVANFELENIPSKKSLAKRKENLIYTSFEDADKKLWNVLNI
jgi:hypothetical protein